MANEQDLSPEENKAIRRAAAAIRMRAKYLEENGYEDSYVEFTKAIAFWLAAEPGRRAFVAAREEEVERDVKAIREMAMQCGVTAAIPVGTGKTNGLLISDEQHDLRTATPSPNPKNTDG